MSAGTIDRYSKEPGPPIVFGFLVLIPASLPRLQYIYLVFFTGAVRIANFMRNDIDIFMVNQSYLLTLIFIEIAWDFFLLL